MVGALSIALVGYAFGAFQDGGTAGPLLATTPNFDAIATTGSTGPSASSQMICEIQTRVAIGSALGLKTLPSPTADWSNQMYTCSYELPIGDFVLTVKELPNVAAAQRYFEGQKHHVGEGEVIQGLASLGLPGFSTTGGIVLFEKDNITLEVDASALKGPLGPNDVSPSDFAYQIATNILACWRAHGEVQ